jgi:hypothetical protein
MFDLDLRRGRRAIESAIAGFARRLLVESLAERVARLETRLHGPSSPDRLFAAEAAMMAAWPSASARRPAHELVWIVRSQTTPSAGWMEIRAFDCRGRVLLACRYATEPEVDAVRCAEGRVHG